MENKITVPTTWKQLTESQLTFVSCLLLTGNTETELLTKAFCRFAGIRVIRHYRGVWICTRKRFGTFMLHDWEITDFLQHVSFLMKGVQEITPLEKLRRKKHIDSRLQGTPFRQYLACENYYQAFLHTKNEYYLRCLAASFYLGRRRFNDAKTARRSNHFKRVSPEELYTVFLWYSGLKEVFAKSFPHFFERTTLMEGQPAPVPNMREQINRQIRALHGGDITKLKAVQETDTWQALDELDAKAHEAKICNPLNPPQRDF
jgi:hypothetical protein